MNKFGTDRVKRGMAEMQKGGVIMDVVNAEQAKIAEQAGAVAVMALERVPSDIRARWVTEWRSRERSQYSYLFPVMANVLAILLKQESSAMVVDYIDESHINPADDIYHINKADFTVPFVCGCRNLGEAVRRIGEGAPCFALRVSGTGNIVEAVRHMRQVQSGDSQGMFHV